MPKWQAPDRRQHGCDFSRWDSPVCDLQRGQSPCVLYPNRVKGVGVRKVEIHNFKCHDVLFRCCLTDMYSMYIYIYHILI